MFGVWVWDGMFGMWKGEMWQLINYENLHLVMTLEGPYSKSVVVILLVSCSYKYEHPAQDQPPGMAERAW